MIFIPYTIKVLESWENIDINIIAIGAINTY